jgi:hypothetical protein
MRIELLRIHPREYSSPLSLLIEERLRILRGPKEVLARYGECEQTLAQAELRLCRIGGLST